MALECQHCSKTGLEQCEPLGIFPGFGWPVSIDHYPQQSLYWVGPCFKAQEYYYDDDVIHAHPDKHGSAKLLQYKLMKVKRKRSQH